MIEAGVPADAWLSSTSDEKRRSRKTLSKEPAG